MFSVVLAILGGLAFAVQGPTNTRLASFVGNLPASAASFGGGIIFLGIISQIFGDGDLSRMGEVPLWMFSGGIFGACMVIIITISVPLLGMAMTVTIIMTGQLIMGMLVDTFGWFGTESMAVEASRIAGCAIIIAGLALVYIGKKQADVKKIPDARTVAVVFAAFLAGAGGAVQAAANAGMASYVGKLEGSWMNFTEGFVFVLAIILLQKVFCKRGAEKNTQELSLGSLKGIRPWMLLGGVYGGTGVCLNVIVTPVIGVALLVTANMFGEIFGGMVLDIFGVLTAKIKMNAWRYAGMLLIFAGVFLV